jgi:1,4-alpha-glucan branching enzyme
MKPSRSPSLETEMIRRTTVDDGTVKITFSLPADSAADPVSVVGSFNDWDPSVHPLRKRSNGTRSVAVELPRGDTVEFRYVTSDGAWLDESDCDGFVTTPYGSQNAIIDLS